MFSQLTLKDLQTIVPVANLKGSYAFGDVAVIFDAVYGPIKAVFCQMQTTKTSALPMAPAVQIAPASAYGYSSAIAKPSDLYTVSHDQDASGYVAGFACGFLMATATANPAYTGYTAGSWVQGDGIWVQVAGINPYALVTDGSVAAGSALIMSGTDGAVSGAVQTVNTSASSTVYWGSYVLGVANTADDSSGTAALAAGLAMVRSFWAALPRTL